METVTLKIEVTDTFSGDANYSWVQRFKLTVPYYQSRLTTMRQIKKVIGWNGIKCRKSDYGDTLALHPYGMCQVCFVDYIYE